MLGLSLIASAGLALVGQASAVPAPSPGPVGTTARQGGHGDCLAGLGHGHDDAVFRGCSRQALINRPQPHATGDIGVSGRDIAARSLEESIAPEVFGGVSNDGPDGLALRLVQGYSVDVARAAGPAHVRVRVIEVRHSLASLRAVTKQLTSDPRVADPALHAFQWGPDVTANAVRLIVGASSDSTLRISLLHDHPDTLMVTRQSTDDTFRQQGTTRYSDSNPWSGGLRVSVRASSPHSGTGGLPTLDAVQPPGYRHISTAGHLMRDGGTPTNDFGPEIGSLGALSYSDGGDDIGLLNANTQPCLWVGGPFDQNDRRCVDTVSNYDRVGDGSGTPSDPSICTDGSETGEVCAGVVESTDQCVQFSGDGTTKVTCSLNVLRSTGQTVERSCPTRATAAGPYIRSRPTGLSTEEAISSEARKSRSTGSTRTGRRTRQYRE